MSSSIFFGKLGWKKVVSENIVQLKFGEIRKKVIIVILNYTRIVHFVRSAYHESKKIKRNYLYWLLNWKYPAVEETFILWMYVGNAGD